MASRAMVVLQLARKPVWVPADGSTKSVNGCAADGLADRRLHVGEEGELEVDVFPGADVAVAAGQVVPSRS